MPDVPLAASDRVRKHLPTPNNLVKAGNTPVDAHITTPTTTSTSSATSASGLAADSDHHPRVSVVIAAHNAADTLGRQLDALANQSGAGPFEVVVALNRCDDNSSEVAQQFTDRLTLTTVDAPDESSCGYARNVGVAVSNGEILLFCDADDRVDSRWVAEMTASLVSGNLDVVAARLVVDRSEVPTWIYRTSYQSADGKCLLQFGEVRYAPGGAMGCRRAVFEAVGGFRPIAGIDPLDAPVGGEDTDLGVRLWQAGVRIGEAPQAVVHFSPRTTTRGFLRRLRRDIHATAALEIREQHITRSSLWILVSRPLLTGGYALILRREWRPRVLAVVVAGNFYGHLTRRRMLKPTTS